MTATEQPARARTSPQPIGALPAGARFRLSSGRTGTLLYANECRARVRFDERETRTITAHAGTTDARTVLIISKGRPVDISPGTAVELLHL